MTNVKTNSWRDMLVDKAMVMKVMDEVNRDIGFVPDPSATARKAQVMMIALGIRPEENIFSCGFIASRRRIIGSGFPILGCPRTSKTLFGRVWGGYCRRAFLVGRTGQHGHNSVGLCGRMIYGSYRLFK